MTYDPRARKLYELRAHRSGGRIRLDAAPVRAHVLRLAQKASLSTIANEAGVAQSTLSRIAAGHYATTTPKIARALYGVTGSIGTGNGYVAAVGTMRRLQALRALGWSLDALAPHVGITGQGISYICAGRTAHVKAVVRDSVERVYRDLSMSLPRPTSEYERAGFDRARRYAARMGWVPPLAWDDDSIDDPAATPHDIAPPKRKTGGQGRPARDVAEDVEFILTHHPYATSIEIAARLGYADQTGVQNALAADRANRPDLLATLARNAEIAGLNVTRRSA